MFKRYYSIPEACEFLSIQLGEHYALRDLVDHARRGELTFCFHYAGTVAVFNVCRPMTAEELSEERSDDREEPGLEGIVSVIPPELVDGTGAMLVDAFWSISASLISRTGELPSSLRHACLFEVFKDLPLSLADMPNETFQQILPCAYETVSDTEIRWVATRFQLSPHQVVIPSEQLKALASDSVFVVKAVAREASVKQVTCNDFSMRASVEFSETSSWEDRVKGLPMGASSDGERFPIVLPGDDLINLASLPALMVDAVCESSTSREQEDHVRRQFDKARMLDYDEQGKYLPAQGSATPGLKAVKKLLDEHKDALPSLQERTHLQHAFYSQIRSAVESGELKATNSKNVITRSWNVKLWSERTVVEAYLQSCNWAIKQLGEPAAKLTEKLPDIAVIKPQFTGNAKSGGDAKNEKYKEPKAFVLNEWAAHRAVYKNNKTDFSRHYVKRVKNEFDVNVTERTMREVWLKDPPSASKPASLPADG